MPLELPEVFVDRRTWRLDGDSSRELEAMGIVAFPAVTWTAPNTTIGGGFGGSMRADVRRYKTAAKTTDTSTTTTTTITMIRAALLFWGGCGGG